MVYAADQDGDFIFVQGAFQDGLVFFAAAVDETEKFAADLRRSDDGAAVMDFDGPPTAPLNFGVFVIFSVKGVGFEVKTLWSDANFIVKWLIISKKP